MTVYELTKFPLEIIIFMIRKEESREKNTISDKEVLFQSIRERRQLL